MNGQYKFSSKSLFSLVLLLLAMVLAGMTTAELLQIAGGNDQDSLISAEALDQLRTDTKTTQQYLGQYQKAADQLARNNSFVPLAQAEPPGDCTAILGDEACFGDRWVRAGDTLGAAKVLEIGPTVVTLQWEGRRITRSPVLVADNSRESSSRNRSTDRRENNLVDEAKIRAAEAQIKAAVAAGKLSRQDAARKIEAINTATGDSAKPEYSVITSVYDARGNLSEEVYNEGTRVLYDAAGNVTEKISADGTVYRVRDRI